MRVILSLFGLLFVMGFSGAAEVIAADQQPEKAANGTGASPGGFLVFNPIASLPNGTIIITVDGVRYSVKNGLLYEITPETTIQGPYVGHDPGT